jgi:hypothetical protein
MPRGSRKHVLDWTDQPRFLPELLQLVRPVSCKITAESIWQPLGTKAPSEARLEQFGPRAYPEHPAWPVLTAWWLRNARGANTPNWDIALSCDVEGQPGLILVEAKANVPELSEAGKWEDEKASPNSEENRKHIGKAIDEARVALNPVLPGISIGRDRHYQLSNRIAFAWRLASLGIPTVLVYLGFTGDTGISDVGTPFTDDVHWQTTVRQHVSGVCPSTVFDNPVDVGPASFWLLSRSRPVISISAPVTQAE